MTFSSNLRSYVRSLRDSSTMKVLKFMARLLSPAGSVCSLIAALTAVSLRERVANV